VTRIAIIVLNWNGLDDTARCLDSLSRLETPEDVEIRVWVVDNASTDGSAELLPERFPWARHLHNEVNYRYAGGNNVGIRAALDDGADFVMLLNNDTEADPSLVADLLGDAHTHPESGVLGPLITDASGRVWFGGGGVSRTLGFTWHRRLGRKPPPRENPSETTDYVTGCCLFVRREVLKKIGPLDEGYYLYAEDTDFCLRARDAGFACRLVPRGRVVHYVSSSSGGAVNPFKAYQRTRAGLRLFERHARGIEQLTWRIGFLAQLVAQSGWWILRGSPSAVGAGWRALVDDIRDLPPGQAYPVTEPHPQTQTGGSA
jgi:GT2 family glycosyltransferase